LAALAVNTRVNLKNLVKKYTGYTALHNSQSHRILQSQALSARFIIFCFRYHGNTVLNATVPAVLPQSLSPLPRYYRSSCFHYRGYRGITVVPITVQVSITDHFHNHDIAAAQRYCCAKSVLRYRCVVKSATIS